MIVRKLPQLKRLPVEESTEPDFLSRMGQRVKQNGFVRDFSWQKVLEKVLLRTESQTNSWLKKLKERTVAQKAIFSDNYWQELKKSTNLAESIPIEEESVESEQPEEVEIKVTKRKARRKTAKPR